MMSAPPGATLDLANLDPDAILELWEAARRVRDVRSVDPEQRARRAESARKAYYTRLALASSVSRRRAVEARSAAVQLEPRRR